MNQPVIDRTYYSDWYYEGEKVRQSLKNRFTRTKVRRVRGLLSPQKGELLIDMGCGAGTMMSLLGDSGATFIGFDYSTNALKHAKVNYTRFNPTLQFRGVCGDGQFLPYKTGTISGIMAVDFTEHLDDDFVRKNLVEICRILKPGGRFVLYTPNPSHLFELLKKYSIILKNDPSHIGLRPMKSYSGMMKSAGLNIDKAFYEPTHLPLVNIVESVIMMIPGIARLARRRICIRAVKPV